MTLMKMLMKMVVFWNTRKQVPQHSTVIVHPDCVTGLHFLKIISNCSSLLRFFVSSYKFKVHLKLFPKSFYVNQTLSNIYGASDISTLYTVWINKILLCLVFQNQITS